MDLVSGLSHFTQNSQSLAIPPPITADRTTTNSIPYSSPSTSSQNQNYPLTIPTALNESSSFPADTRRPTFSPTAPQPALSHTRDHPSHRLSSEGSRPSPPGRYAETLDSRWEALQQNSAPFPPLMKYPTVWSGEPAAPTSQDDPDAESAPGLKQYVAKVGLRSDPISEGILDKSFALTLFDLCVFSPLLFESCANAQSAAFSVTVILRSLSCNRVNTSKPTLNKSALARRSSSP